MTIEFPSNLPIAEVGREASKLLIALDEMTPPARKNEREERLAESVAEHAGLAEAGSPDTRMARVLVAFKRLEEYGYVVKVKHPDAQARYRLSQLGERTVMMQRIAGLEARVRDEAATRIRELEQRLENAVQTGQELDEQLQDEQTKVRLLKGAVNAHNEKVWWKRLGKVKV